MNCPYCLSPLQSLPVTTKSSEAGQVHECSSCGGHWFPHWLTNDISVSEAANIDAVTPHPPAGGPTPPASQPRCPVCQNRLTLISHDSIAKGIHIYACPQGHGNFFPQHELLRFKKAQEAKITYHTLWGIPIKSLLAVMLPVIAVLTIAAGVPLTLEELQERRETRTQASRPYSLLTATQISDTSILISFTTQTSMTSSLALYTQQKLLSQQPISSDPRTNHQLVLRDLDPALNYSYTLTLANPLTQATITTDYYPLTLKSTP